MQFETELPGVVSSCLDLNRVKNYHDDKYLKSVSVISQEHDQKQDIKRTKDKGETGEISAKGE